MNTRLWIGAVALGAGVGLLAPAPIVAQARQRYPYEIGQSSRVGYENGYRAGVTAGERDGRSRRSFDYSRDRVYQRADAGYRGPVSRDSYRTSFRQGYEQGYRTGYERYARGAWSRNDSRYPTYPGSPNYPSYPGYGGYSRDNAFDRGYQDGYNQGLESARDNDRYDPYREKDYRKGDRGYNKSYGSKDQYRHVYREGFKNGYERAYSEARYRLR